jgi:hypothetical protein
MTQQVDMVRGRDCGGCTMCCKLLSVEEISTPPLSWCPSCDTKRGCTIYQQRPTECRQFYCEYLLDPALGEHWKPSKCKMVVVFEDYTNTLVIHVDPDRPHTWREEPFRSDLRQWIKAAGHTQRQVIVWQGNSKIVLTGASRGENGAGPMIFPGADVAAAP